MDKIDSLIKTLTEFKEELNKAAQDNALHRLFRDLAPHVNSATLGNLKEDKGGLSHSDQPHKDGLVSFDIQHHPNKKDIVNKILEQHGHFRHPSTFGENMDINDDLHHQYGSIQLHPERAKFLKPGPSLSADVKPGQNLVNKPAFGSQNMMEGSMTGEGNIKPAKWQGSDPRHEERQGGIDGQTRAGNPVAIAEKHAGYTMRNPQALTAGVSNKGYSRVETGLPVKKSNNNQWSFKEELNKNINCAPGSNPNMSKEELSLSENGQWSLTKTSATNTPYFKKPVSVDGTPLHVKYKNGLNYSVHTKDGNKVGHFKVHHKTGEVSGSLNDEHKSHHEVIKNKVNMLHQEMEQSIADEAKGN